jgi:glycine/D-amino acid oxidase-like deaminating enzyme
MGAATAYYLAQLGVAATVVEREAVAAAASGAQCCANTAQVYGSFHAILNWWCVVGKPFAAAV